MPVQIQAGQPVPCVVLGSQYKVVYPTGLSAIDAFIEKYRIVPDPLGTEFQEVNSTVMIVNELSNKSGTVGLPQDGGNGSGGDSTGAEMHFHSGVQTPGALSFWKIDSGSIDLLQLLVGTTSSAKTSPQQNPYRNALGSKASDAYRSINSTSPTVPGCAFFFASHDAAYRWLSNPNGGAAMSSTYDEVRIVAVNAVNP